MPPTRVRLNSVMWTGVESSGASHLSTCERNEWSEVTFTCGSHKWIASSGRSHEFDACRSSGNLLAGASYHSPASRRRPQCAAPHQMTQIRKLSNELSGRPVLHDQPPVPHSSLRAHASFAGHRPEQLQQPVLWVACAGMFATTPWSAAKSASFPVLVIGNDDLELETDPQTTASLHSRCRLNPLPTWYRLHAWPAPVYSHNIPLDGGSAALLQKTRSDRIRLDHNDRDRVDCVALTMRSCVMRWFGELKQKPPAFQAIRRKGKARFPHRHAVWLKGTGDAAQMRQFFASHFCVTPRLA